MGRRPCTQQKHSGDVGCVQGLIASLPFDLLVELVAKIAAGSTSPLLDLIRLRQTCKALYDASKEREVGRRMAVKREWRLHWWNKRSFFSLIRSCADSGNLDASFILGLEELFNGKRDSGMRHLLTAMAGGHSVAAYVAGIILFHNPQTRLASIELLDKLVAYPSTALSRGKIRALRHEAAALMRKMTMERWPVEPRIPCTDQMCGSISEEKKRSGEEGWLGGDERRFCSPQCRWKYEYHSFLEII